MAAPPSVAVLLANQAEKLYTAKNWKKACANFNSYFTKKYPDQQFETAPLEDTKRLVLYADALFSKTKEEAVVDEAGNKTYDAEELESVTEYLLVAKAAYSKDVDGVSPSDVLQVCELLGELARMNGQYTLAAKQYTDAYRLAVDNNMGWRHRLSLMWNVAISHEINVKRKSALESVQTCMKITDEEIAAAKARMESSGEDDKLNDDVNELVDFRATFVDKMGSLEKEIEEKPEETEERENEDDADEDDADEDDEDDEDEDEGETEEDGDEGEAAPAEEGE